MTRAKPAFDKDGSWKHRQFSASEWEALTSRVQVALRPLYPEKNAEEDPTFGHPADEWANSLLSAADRAISTVLWLQRRLTNEELRAEQADLLNTLKKAAEKLGAVSHDLDILFGIDADVLGTRDAIIKLMPYVEESLPKIANLPRARNIKDAQSAAADEMAIRCLRILKDARGKVSATADKSLGSASIAAQLMKILGDELGLLLDITTWKRVIVKAKKVAPDLR